MACVNASDGAAAPEGTPRVVSGVLVSCWYCCWWQVAVWTHHCLSSRSKLRHHLELSCACTSHCEIVLSCSGAAFTASYATRPVTSADDEEVKSVVAGTSQMPKKTPIPAPFVFSSHCLSSTGCASCRPLPIGRTLRSSSQRRPEAWCERFHLQYSRSSYL